MWEILRKYSKTVRLKQGENGCPSEFAPDFALNGFTISALARFQDTCLDQYYYYYGSGFNGNWGYVDNYRRFAKVYYAVKGLDGAKRVTATVLDNDRDCLDCPVEFRNGKVRLTKAERRSAAFMVTFEL